jgi:hypothetical protein
MPPSLRILLSHCAIVVLVLVVFSSAAPAQTSSAPNQPSQPAQAAPTAQAQLPAKWSDAVRALAEKIASTAGSPRRIFLDVKNISSLDSSSILRIRQAIQAELGSNGFKPGPGGLRVHVTLSEGSDGYIWVAEFESANGRQVAIVSAPREPVGSPSQAKISLSLDKRLVWEQPEKFVDFELFTRPVGMYSTLLILEPDRLAYYRAADSKWEFWKSVPISHSRPLPRDLPGGINSSTDTEIPWLPGVQCSGDVEDPDKIQCGPLKTDFVGAPRTLNPPAHEQGEFAALSDRCGADSVLMVSGSGDWTQPDTIQGYLLPDVEGQAMPSGSALAMDGPVMDIQADGRGLAGRAVVRNLKTSKFEAYIVTATCSH